MKDLYEALGIEKNATAREIKIAYRKLSLRAHPDRGGSQEQMQLLNEAYETLADPQKKREFDKKWQDYQVIEEDDVEVDFAGYFDADGSVRFSQSYKNSHSEIVQEYRNKTYLIRQANYLNQFCENRRLEVIYKTEIGNKTYSYDNIYAYLQAKSFALGKCTRPILDKDISPEYAVILLQKFLAGEFFSDAISIVLTYFEESLNNLKQLHYIPTELKLYQAIFAIIKQVQDRDYSHLIFELQKIKTYALETSSLTRAKISSIFHSKTFRGLCHFALEGFWQSPNSNLIMRESLAHFNGGQEAENLKNVLKEKLTHSSEYDNSLRELIRYVKILNSLDKQIRLDAEYSPEEAHKLRQFTFDLLDWLPILMNNSSREIIANTLLIIGVQLQKTSHLEKNLCLKFADEKLAMQLYLSAHQLAQECLPDFEIYINTLVVKCLLSMTLEHEDLDDIIQTLAQKATDKLNVFPLLSLPKSNIHFFRQKENSESLLRSLIQNLLAIYEHNKTHSTEITLDHKPSTILYHSYEASLKNWLTEVHDPVLENNIRVELMQELLLDRGWTLFDVEQHLSPDWIMVDRDKDGWLTPTDALPYNNDPKYQQYKTILGATLNQKTGEIRFYLEPWQQHNEAYDRLFTFYDAQELLEKNITGAVFSLDPADPKKPYHPFNLMRFYPNQLYQSELLTTMLLTDYTLKFLTTDQEVQGQHPFAQRPVRGMLKHLPYYLKKIIADYQQQKSHQSGAIHRFWIEAESIDVDLSDFSNQEKMQLKLSDIKMVVKKHRMQRDINGELMDVSYEDEGWPIYVLKKNEFHQLVNGYRFIDGRAMIFIYAEYKLYYWDNHQVICDHKPEDFRIDLNNLFFQPLNSEGKIEPTTSNMPLLFRATTKMAQQTGQAHHFSNEFTFAHHFTTHYNEFAQYLPEFGRLRELSKIIVLVRFLNNIREANLTELKVLNHLLNNKSSISRDILESETYQQYHQQASDIKNNVVDCFYALRKNYATSKLRKKWQGELARIKSNMGSLNFSLYSPEVEQICQEFYNDVARQNPGVPSSRIWSEVINPQRNEIAQNLSKRKYESCREQVYDIFQDMLSRRVGYGRYNQLINSFMSGEFYTLTNELIAAEQDKVAAELLDRFPQTPREQIRQAFDDQGSAAADNIARAEARAQLLKVKKRKDVIEQGFFNINLGKHEQEPQIEHECFWVPASVKHEVNTNSPGNSRHSFFVYGGVNIQPRTNLTHGGSGPLGGNRGGGNGVGGGGFNRANITKGFQDHHIVSDKNRNTKASELFALAGININSRVNKIFLPTQANLHATRSVHLGRHTNSYSERVADKMGEIVELGKSAGWTQTQYRAETTKLLSELRQELKAGNIGLNKHQRPWAQKW